MKRFMTLIFVLICGMSMLSGCMTSNKNEQPANSSAPTLDQQGLFYGEVMIPDEMFSVITFYNDYLVYLTLDKNNQAGISRFDVNTGDVVEICKLDDYKMNPANNTVLAGKIYLNYMANDASRKMLEIDIEAAVKDTIVTEDNVAGLVYCAATSESVFSLKHTMDGRSVVEHYVPKTKTNDIFLVLESNKTACAISTYGEHLYVLLCDEAGEYCVMQYSDDGSETDIWELPFVSDILQDSQAGFFQVMDSAFYIMNFSGQSAAFYMDGTPIDELSGKAIATDTAGSFSNYTFFGRGSNLDLIMYDTNKETLDALQICKEETDSIRYIYSDCNNPQRMLVSLRNTKTGVETVSIISAL